MFGIINHYRMTNCDKQTKHRCYYWCEKHVTQIRPTKEIPFRKYCINYFISVMVVELLTLNLFYLKLI